MLKSKKQNHLKEGHLTAWILNLESKKDVNELYEAFRETFEKRFLEDESIKELRKDSNKISYSNKKYSKIILEKDFSEKGNNKIKLLVSDVK